MKKIEPYCLKQPGAFVEFTGLVTPCCWLVTDQWRHNKLKEFLGNEYDNVFITKSQETIIEAYKKLQQSWDSDQPFETCVIVCGKDND